MGENANGSIDLHKAGILLFLSCGVLLLGSGKYRLISFSTQGN